jgi:hypothetical protein
MGCRKKAVRNKENCEKKKKNIYSKTPVFSSKLPILLHLSVLKATP